MKLSIAFLLGLFLLPLSALALDVDARILDQLESGETMNAWVFFEDRSEDLLLERALDHISERALARRAKVLSPDRLLSEMDLPVSAAHQNWLLQRGVEIRAESRWLNAVSVRLDADGLRVLEEADFIRRVQPVAKSASRRPSSLEPLPWSLNTREVLEDPIDYGGTEAEIEQINVHLVHQTGNHGEGVVVGMLDTGFNTNHEVFQSLTVLGVWDFINDDDVVENEAGDPDGQQNHGTVTLSSLAGYKPGTHVGVAFGASYYLAKTEDTSQEVPAEEDFWVEGVEWLEAQGCDVVSSSLGYDDWYVFEDFDGNTCVTTIAGDYASQLGMAVVNSAGNNRNSTGTMNAPADGDSVISVGAVNVFGEIASFSSPGPTADGRIKPDICANGVANHVALPGTWDEYTDASGTSLSCPLAAGVSALLISANPTLTPWELREALRETASQSGSPDNDYGWGIIDAYAALNHVYATHVDAAPAPRDRLAAWPNPFNPETTFDFRLEVAGEIYLSVYDLEGRLVEEIARGQFEAGDHSINWKPDGDRIASGIYLALLKSDRGTAISKVALVK
jgi:serine protease AprX